MTFSPCSETASNLRRDITAETSLMNDLDKRLNVDLDSSNCTTPEPFSKRNVNLLISLHSDDNLNGNSQSWLIHDSSKTNSDNGSCGRSGMKWKRGSIGEGVEREREGVL